MNNELRVVLSPKDRGGYIDRLLELDGLSHIDEDVNAAYCPISLTSTPPELKSAVQLRQEHLMNDVLEKVGITAYDPGSAPYSPDKNLTSQPNEVYAVDSQKIVGARYFVGHNILPSSGQGIEVEKAKMYNRMAVIFMDANIRVSRMQPHRAIYLQYTNFQEQAKDFIPVFEMLQKFDPGMGFKGSVPVLLGFEKGVGRVVDLEAEVYSAFPDLQYTYDGTKSIVDLRTQNPEIFYENA